MSSLTDSDIRNLPAPIVDKLQSLIGRVRRLIFLRGLFATIAAGLISILIIMAIDASFTLFSDTARWALSLCGLAFTSGIAWNFLIQPLSRKLTLTHIARILETRHPELQERISSAVELMRSDDPDSIKGSKELIDEVVSSAVIDVKDVQPENEFDNSKTQRFFLRGGYYRIHHSHSPAHLATPDGRPLRPRHRPFPRYWQRLFQYSHR